MANEHDSDVFRRLHNKEQIEKELNKKPEPVIRLNGSFYFEGVHEKAADALGFGLEGLISSEETEHGRLLRAAIFEIYKHAAQSSGGQLSTGIYHFVIPLTGGDRYLSANAKFRFAENEGGLNHVLVELLNPIDVNVAPARLAEIIPPQGIVNAPETITDANIAGMVQELIRYGAERLQTGTDRGKVVLDMSQTVTVEYKAIGTLVQAITLCTATLEPYVQLINVKPYIAAQFEKAGLGQEFMRQSQ